jgi:integrase
MPSVPFDLGKYVTLRHRKDGTARVFFQVPERLRPSDWPSLIPLPHQERRGDLTDASEVQRIQQDAAALYDRLQAARMGRAVVADRRDVKALNRLWQQSGEFKAKRPTTQKGYAYHAGLVEDWATLLGNPLVEALSYERIGKLFAAYDDRPTTRRHVKIVLQMLLTHAQRLGWITANPAKLFKMKAPETTVEIWEQADVDFYAGAARDAGQPGLAALIETEWEIGQRLTDARLFMHNREYKAGVFRFWQSKTGAWVTAPVSEKAADAIEAVRDPDSPYLFRDATTGKPFASERLGHVFLALKEKTGGRDLTLRALRHSCVVQLARSGNDIPAIASLTGHKPQSAASILATYLPRDNEMAWEAQRKRGLIGTESGHKSNGPV